MNCIEQVKVELSQFKFIDMYQKLQRAKDKRLLVVDDEEFCISAMQIILQMGGIDTDS